MSTQKILLGIGAIIVVAAVYLLMTNGNDEKMMQDEIQKKEMMQKDAMKKDDSMKDGAMMQKGSYEPYAPEKLTKADSGDVVLFFRASWCPTCKALDSDIRAHVSEIPAALTILDVDYDNSAALKQKYGVTYQHTFVQVGLDGTVIKKWSGSPTLASLVGQVQ